MAALSCRPTAAKPAPVIGMLMPILRTVSAATAGRATKPPAAAAAMPFSTVLRNMMVPPICFPLPLWGGISSSHPFEMRNLRPLALRLAGDRRPRQARLAVFHDEGVLERIPRRFDVGRAGARLVVAHIIADEVAGDAELGIGFEVLVLGIVELRDQRLEARLVNQKVKMRRPHIVPALRAQQLADRAVDRDRITGRLDTAEADVAAGVGGELPA